MKCKNCGTHNSARALKCVNCNAPLDGSMVMEKVSYTNISKGNVTCKNCQATNAADALKCHQCNAPLDGSMVVNPHNSPGPGHAQVMCKNCKSFNPADSLRCHSCNAPLDGSLVIKNAAVAPSPKIDKSTTMMQQPARSAGNICPHCAYPNQSIATSCVKCNTALNPVSFENKKEETLNDPKPLKKAMDMTINPYASAPASAKGFSLTPLNADLSDEKSPISFTNDSNNLDRSTLYPGNNTITSAGQATITRKDHSWIIEDNSAMKTTFVQVQGQITLKDGDILLMGNKMFRFTAE